MCELLKKLEADLKENPWSDELEGFTIVESGDWTDNHKSECKEDVVQHIESGRYFMVFFDRTGDHWQGYETDFGSAVEVEPYQKTITAWKTKEATNV